MFQIPFATTAAICAVLAITAAAPAELENRSGRSCAYQGQIDIFNDCDFGIDIWSDDSSVVYEASLPGSSKGHFAQNLREDDRSGYLSYRIKKQTDKYSVYDPALVPVYVANEKGLYIGLSSIFGNPFEGHNITWGASADECEDKSVAAGASINSNEVVKCQKGNLYVRLCSK